TAGGGPSPPLDPEAGVAAAKLAPTDGSLTAAQTSTADVGAKATDPLGPGPPLADRLFREPFAFDFFQAVRLLEKLYPDRVAVGRGATPNAEVVRFRAHLSLSFPPSSIYDLTPAADPSRPPVMTAVFLGLTGPSGVLPRHYTELMLRLQREGKGPERY